MFDLAATPYEENREYLARMSVLESRVAAVEKFLAHPNNDRRARRAADVEVYWAAENASSLQAETSSSKFTHYGVLVRFNPNGLTARCECPDTHPVCKHLIAVCQRFTAARRRELDSGELSGL